jgi:hypothetical protein
MTSTIRFFKTNRTDDPGYELTADEAARRFWESETAQGWLTDPGMGLERLAGRWVTDNVGEPGNLPEDWGPIFNAIGAAMPRPGDSRHDAEAYERQPLSLDGIGSPQPAAGDPTDDTDWEEVYQDLINRGAQPPPAHESDPG